ncbi:Meiotic nuclear division protein 1-like protein, partial [Frankliniella fusca]
MSKKKGLSVDEKRSKLLEIFYEKKEFFTYDFQELEKIAPKEKGIVVQSVKDVLMSLVHDNIVDTDKIGTSVFFWAFPSKERNAKRKKLDDLKCRLAEENTTLKSIREKIISAKVGREDTEKRMKILQNRQIMLADEEKLTLELQKYKESDPETLERKKKEIKIAKEAANQWTDNIFSIKTWCRNKYNVEESVLDKDFRIPSDLDY